MRSDVKIDVGEFHLPKTGSSPGRSTSLTSISLVTSSITSLPLPPGGAMCPANQANSWSFEELLTSVKQQVKPYSLLRTYNKAIEYVVVQVVIRDRREYRYRIETSDTKASSISIGISSGLSEVSVSVSVSVQGFLQSRYQSRYPHCLGVIASRYTRTFYVVTMSIFWVVHIRFLLYVNFILIIDW